jgi:hypothetical protein
VENSVKCLPDSWYHVLGNVSGASRDESRGSSLGLDIYMGEYQSDSMQNLNLD